MRRIIKFRVWDKKFRGKKKYAYTDACGRLELRGVRMTLEDLQTQGTHFNDRYVFEQYVGIKDRNEKEIYEGDILDEHYESEGREPCSPTISRERTVEVYWDEDSHSYKLRCEGQFKGMVDTWHLPLFGSHFEVIGNIQENPGLAMTTYSKIKC